MKSIIAFLSGHSHYFGVPHRNDDRLLIQICYSCGKTRRVKADLEVAP